MNKKQCALANKARAQIRKVIAHETATNWLASDRVAKMRVDEFANNLGVVVLADYAACMGDIILLGLADTIEEGRSGLTCRSC